MPIVPELSGGWADRRAATGVLPALGAAASLSSLSMASRAPEVTVDDGGGRRFLAAAEPLAGFLAAAEPLAGFAVAADPLSGSGKCSRLVRREEPGVGVEDLGPDCLPAALAAGDPDLSRP